MAFAGINWLAVLLATGASFLFGGVWYGMLSQQWLEALGKTDQELKAAARPMPALFGMTIVAEFVMATLLAGVIGHLGAGQVTAINGVITAFFVWLGFVATTLVVNHGYQGSPLNLTAIDGGHWLGVLLIQGLLIGLMGVA